MGDWLYFVASRTFKGIELHKTDGTSANTVLVKDIWPGPGHGMSQNGLSERIASTGSLLIFQAESAAFTTLCLAK
jgi:ELWxxDGT repeat protein